VSPLEHSGPSGATCQDSSSPAGSQPVTIDQTFNQQIFSTFGVASNSPTAKDHDSNHEHFVQQTEVDQTDSLYKDGLEESHSSFSTFNVPANQYI